MFSRNTVDLIPAPIDFFGAWTMDTTKSVTVNSQLVENYFFSRSTFRPVDPLDWTFSGPGHGQIISGVISNALN